jgi:hypothetical protein
VIALVTPVAVALKALGVPFVLASASDSFELAKEPVLHEAKNLGKPTNLKSLAQALMALRK